MVAVGIVVLVATVGAAAAALLWVLLVSPPSAVDQPIVLSATPSPDDTAGASDPFGPAEHDAPTGLATVAVADPVAVRIHSIDVVAGKLKALDVLDDGTLEVPSDPQRAGWWRAGPEPGEDGPAVIVGHVDSRDGPGVFFDLRDVTAGDRIDVDRADGSTVTFQVARVEQHAKDGFPTAAVYGSTDEPALRLVTCGGAFDDGTGHYMDNIVVFARLFQPPAGVGNPA